LLFLESDNPDKDIHLYINSPGGSVTAGLAIYDTMQYIASDVCTICVGQAYSMGAILLAGGARGKRQVLPNSRILLHQPLGGIGGQAADMEIHAREILKVRRQLDELLAHGTVQSLERVRHDTERDFFIGPEDAKEYGLIDEIIAAPAADVSAAGG